MKNAIYLLLWLVMAAQLNAATGSAETVDVTVDTRSDNADLSELTISSGTLSPAFASGTTDYTASVLNATTSLIVTPTKAEPNAIIESRVNGGAFAPVTSGSSSGALALSVGTNPIDLRVTAQDTVTTKNYTITVTRDKATQTIDFNAIGEQIATATVNLFATGGGSGNPVAFAVASGPATITSGTTLTFTGAGSVTVIASQAGNTTHHAAPPVEQTFSVSKASQILTFDLSGERFIGEVLSLIATGGESGNPVTFVVISGPASLDGNDLSFTGEGEVTITAGQEGDDNHDPAMLVERMFNVILPRPDVAVGASFGELLGSGIYTAPGGQLISLTSKKARPVTGYARVANRVVLPDDRAADVLTVRGTAGNGFFRVSYFAPEGNVTAGLVTGTHRTAAIDEDDGPIALRAVVIPNKKKLTRKKGNKTKILKKNFSIVLQASSTAWPAAGDGGTIRVQTK